MAVRMPSNNKTTRSSTRLPVSPATRDLVKAQKRQGETYDHLLREMVDQYDPKEASTSN